MFQLSFNPEFKPHFFLALFLSVWLATFLIFIAPFDLGTIPLNVRLVLVPPYGLIFLFSYIILIPIQNWLYRKNGRWNILLELLFITLFFLLTFSVTFFYYKSPVVNGDYSFSQFLSGIYLPIFILLAAIIFLTRWLLTKLVPPKVTSKTIILRGDNRSDQLQVNPDHIICISSAQNYVEVFFQIEGRIEKKLLRTTLKKMSTELPEMIQVQRSHIINPRHFTRWKDSSIAIVNTMEIPVSKNYKEGLVNYLNTHP